MSTMPHTPGPWELSYDKGGTRDVIASSDKIPICVMRLSWVSHEAYHANARLVAASPDLLAALQRLLAVVESARAIAIKEPAASSPLVTELQTCGGAVFEAQDAIAKARGAS